MNCELPHASWSRRAHGFEKPFDDRTQVFIGLPIERRAGQTRIAPVQERRTQHLQSPNRPVEQSSYNGFGGCVAFPA